MAEDELTRELGLVEATTIGLGTMIGGGIFILPSLAAEQAGPASMVSFAIAGGIALLAALTHAELATAMPREGGSYAYVHRGLGAPVGTIVGWGIWAGTIFSSAFYAVGFGQYVTFFAGDVPVTISAAAVIILLTGLNLYGAAETGEVEDLLVIVLVLIIVGFIVFGLPSVSPGRFQPVAPEGLTGVLVTVGTLYIAFVGFTVTAAAAGEVRNPSRNLPIAIVSAVIIPLVLYVAVMFVSIGALPTDELAASRIPVADVAAVYLGNVGAGVMTIGALLATVSSANAAILQASRISFAMGERATLSSWFTVTHDRFGTPYRSIAITGIAILALIGIGTALETLAEVAGVIYFFSFGLVHLALIKLRAGGKGYEPTFRIPDLAMPWLPLVGVVAILAVFTVVDPAILLIASLIVGMSAIWYVVRVSPRRAES